MGSWCFNKRPHHNPNPKPNPNTTSNMGRWCFSTKRRGGGPTRRCAATDKTTCTPRKNSSRGASKSESRALFDLACVCARRVGCLCRPSSVVCRAVCRVLCVAPHLLCRAPCIDCFRLEGDIARLEASKDGLEEQRDDVEVRPRSSHQHHVRRPPPPAPRRPLPFGVRWDGVSTSFRVPNPTSAPSISSAP